MKIDFFHRDKKLFCYLSVDEMFNNAPAISGSILAEPSIFHPFDSKAALPFDEIRKFIAGRVFDAHRPDCKELLSDLGLEDYDVMEIAKKTHGMLFGDECWIRFDDEDFTWEDAYEFLHH